MHPETADPWRIHKNQRIPAQTPEIFYDHIQYQNLKPTHWLLTSKRNTYFFCNSKQALPQHPQVFVWICLNIPNAYCRERTGSSPCGGARSGNLSWITSCCFVTSRSIMESCCLAAWDWILNQMSYDVIYSYLASPLAFCSDWFALWPYLKHRSQS